MLGSSKRCRQLSAASSRLAKKCLTTDSAPIFYNRLLGAAFFLFLFQISGFVSNSPNFQSNLSRRFIDKLIEIAVSLTFRAIVSKVFLKSRLKSVKLLIFCDSFIKFGIKTLTNQTCKYSSYSVSKNVSKARNYRFKNNLSCWLTFCRQLTTKTFVVRSFQPKICQTVRLINPFNKSGFVSKNNSIKMCSGATNLVELTVDLFNF